MIAHFVVKPLSDFRLTSTADGLGLAVSNATSADEGRYQCVAKNVVGIRTSRKAALSIIGKWILMLLSYSVTDYI